MQDLGRYNDDSLDTRNPAPRCPVILLLDTSSSMEGAQSMNSTKDCGSSLRKLPMMRLPPGAWNWK